MKCENVKIKCFKFECETCHIVGTCQCFYNNSGELKYARIRHYDKTVSGKAKFLYHAQTLAYVKAQLEKQNQQALSSKIEVDTVASRSKVASDQLGQESNIDLEKSGISLEKQIKSGLSPAWLGHQVPNLTTRVQIPETAPTRFFICLDAAFSHRQHQGASTFRSDSCTAKSIRPYSYTRKQSFLSSDGEKHESSSVVGAGSRRTPTHG